MRLLHNTMFVQLVKHYYKVLHVCGILLEECPWQLLFVSLWD